LNRNLHRSFEDPIQRLLNAGEPGSYVRPHRHAARWELFVVLRGRIDALLFANDGTVMQRIALKTPGGMIELPGGTWHSIVFIETGSVALEVKPGPYIAASDKEFAVWAPPEDGGAAAIACAQWLAAAQPGMCWVAP
jgi:cupin fold WbuC family metalloprotein